MSKVAFLIPGFMESSDRPGIKEISQHLGKKGYKVHAVSVQWRRRVMTKYIESSIEYFNQNKGSQNLVLGFSFGAMIAYLSAAQLKPNNLFLCSLSPYFAEEILTIPEKWTRSIGKRRTNDFKHHSFNSIARSVVSNTVIFIGEKEAIKYSDIKDRADEAARLLPKSRLIAIKNAKHDIGQAEYLSALYKEIAKL